MAYKSEAEYEAALAVQRAEVKGEWHLDEYVIRKSKPYNLLQIEREDGTPVHKSLRGQWTELELAKQAIKNIAGASSIE